MDSFLENKKVLLVGLGILGGGLSTARWLLKHGADLTITDLKNEDQLRPSLEGLKQFQGVKYVLGRNDEKDVHDNDIIIFNPDVPLSSPMVKLAEKLGKQIENELTLFSRFADQSKVIAVTGTRGKTTTVNWIGHFLKAKYPGTVITGNSPEMPLLSEIENIRDDSPIVIETPSFLLERTVGSAFKPHIAVITNIFPDHLNRYNDIEHYAMTKGNIFSNQNSNDVLIIGADEKWKKFFIGMKPRSEVVDPLSDENVGKFVDLKSFIEKWGEHNLLNLKTAIRAAKVFGLDDELIKKSINRLPQIKFRQELVYNDGILKIYNDTCATSPEGAMAAIERFGNDENLILITGGTDRNLEFKPLADIIVKKIKDENLILLEGSATRKITGLLGGKELKIFPSLEECFNEAVNLARSYGRATILFSPGSKSFEKFKNEFDRGEQFNTLVKKLK